VNTRAVAALDGMAYALISRSLEVMDEIAEALDVDQNLTHQARCDLPHGKPGFGTPLGTELIIPK